LEQVNLGKRLERSDLELALKLNDGFRKLADSLASGKRPTDAE